MSEVSNSHIERPAWCPLWVAFGAILCLAFLVRVIALDQGLWGDQITVFQIAQLDWKQLVYSVSSQEVHPPLSYLLLHSWLLMGSSEVWARGLFVLFGLGTCVMTYGVGQALAGRRFGLFAMGVAAVLPSAVWASRYLRSYIVGAFFAGAAAWCFVRLLKGKRSARDWAMYSVFSALAMHSYYFNVLLLAAQGLYGISVGWRWRRWVGPLLLSQGLAVSSLLLLVQPAVRTLGTAGIENPISTRFMLLHKVGFYIYGVHVGGLIRSLAGSLGVDTLFLAGPLHRAWPRPLLVAVGLIALVGTAILLYWGCRWLNKQGHEAAGIASGTWVASMLLVPVGIANALHNLTPIAMLPHYFIPLVPFAACLVAGVVMSMPRRWLAGVAIGLFVLFCGARLYTIYLDEGINWRRALPHLEARWQPGDVVVFLQPNLKGNYDFYATRRVPQIGLDTLLTEAMNTEVETPGFSAAIGNTRARLDQFKRLWFLRTEPYHFEQEQAVTKWVRLQYKPIDEQRFGQLVLTLLVSSSST